MTEPIGPATAPTKGSSSATTWTTHPLLRVLCFFIRFADGVPGWTLSLGNVGNGFFNDAEEGSSEQEKYGEIDGVKLFVRLHQKAQQTAYTETTDDANNVTDHFYPFTPALYFSVYKKGHLTQN